MTLQRYPKGEKVGFEAIEEIEAKKAVEAQKRIQQIHARGNIRLQQMPDDIQLYKEVQGEVKSRMVREVVEMQTRQEYQQSRHQPHRELVSRKSRESPPQPDRRKSVDSDEFIHRHEHEAQMRRLLEQQAAEKAEFLREREQMRIEQEQRMEALERK